MVEQYEKVEGGCFCGAVRYEAEANLKEAYYCHCRTCQKMSGAPAEIGIFVKRGSLHFPKEKPKYLQSSPIGKRGFCPHCGSRLIWMSPDKEEWTNLSAGSLDHPENVEPSEHICVESQLPWYDVADNLPRKHSEDVDGLEEAWAEAGFSHDGKPL